MVKGESNAGACRKVRCQQVGLGARGQLLFDEPVIVQCYTGAELIEQQAGPLHDFLVRMGTEAKQGAVGLVIDRDYLEIRFPLSGQSGS